MTLEGVTQVNGYPGLVKDSDNTLHVGTAAALASLNKYITDKGFTTPMSETMVLDADIDAAGLTWKGSFKAGSHPFTFDGNGHTIANLNIVGGFFTGVGGSSNKNAEVKNITFSNCKTTGTWHAGTVWGNMYGNVVFTNVNVINCKVNANSAAGGIIGVYGEGNGSTYGATFNGCSVKNTVITANGSEATKAGASQFVGLVDYFIANESSGKNPVVYGTKYIRFGEGNSVSNNTCNNPEGMLGGGIYTIGYLKNEGGVSNITSGLSVVSEFQDGSITEPANP